MFAFKASLILLGVVAGQAFVAPNAGIPTLSEGSIYRGAFSTPPPSRCLRLLPTIITMAPSLTLTYFKFAGPAEPVRMALAMTGQPWEDKRVSFEEFPAMKPGLPNGQLPILEIDGKVLPQSGAQLRYVGKMAGLYPEDPLEAAYADAAVDAVADNHMKLAPTVQQKDEAKKMEMRQDLASGFLPTWLGNLEKALEKAGGNYFAGDKLSIGDIAVVARLIWLTEGSLDGIPTTILDAYPLLAALMQRVNGEPRIVAYHAKRAESSTN